MKKVTLMIAALSLGLAGVAQAETFTITLTDGSTSIGSGTLTATDDGGGTFTATSGTLTIPGLAGGATFYLDPVPTGQDTVTIHGIDNTGGADLSGDDLVINNNLDSSGLIFTNPSTTTNGTGFGGDVYNLWGNGGDSFTLAYGGPDFDPGLHEETISGSVAVAPEPLSWTLVLLSLGLLVCFRHRNRFVRE